jgi:hypothetical protein
MIEVIPGRIEDANPESRDSPMCNCTSEVWSFGPSRNDEGAHGSRMSSSRRPSPFSNFFTALEAAISSLLA